jgi:hypothetical protein
MHKYVFFSLFSVFWYLSGGLPMSVARVEGVSNLFVSLVTVWGVTTGLGNGRHRYHRHRVTVTTVTMGNGLGNGGAPW